MPSDRFSDKIDVDKLAEAALAILSLTLHDGVASLLARRIMEASVPVQNTV